MIFFYLHEHGVTLGCVAVSSLEAAALLLARVGSETGAATFLDLHSGKIPSLYLVYQARRISPALPTLPVRERNWSI